MKRQEIKFLINKEHFLKLRFEKKFSKIYESRKVNSIYYDTTKFKFFFDSEEGTTPRKKIRFRYYNDDFNNVKLEQKFTYDYYRKKKVENFDMNLIIDNKISKLIEGEIVRPVVEICYLREYYLSEIGRITLDHKIKFRKLNKFKIDEKRNFRNLLNYKNLRILEIKTNDSVTKYDALKFIGSNDLRFSKYCEAIKKII